MNMPIIRPVPIETKGKNWLLKIWIWIWCTRKWELMEDYVFEFRLIKYFIPKGFIFDGASIPKYFWRFLSPVGLLFISAIFHDFAYRYGGYLYYRETDFKGDRIFNEKSKSDIDIIFLQMNDKINGMKVLNFIAWLGVQLGWFTWLKHRKKNLMISLKANTDYYSIA